MFYLSDEPQQLEILHMLPQPAINYEQSVKIHIINLYHVIFETLP